MSLINIGLSGIKVNQSALATTGNNVVNTNTPGYSRQHNVIESNPSQYIGVGYQGTGANTANIIRINDQFLTNQLRADTTVYHEQDTYLSQIEQLDSLLADVTTGLTPAMNNFFAALQGGADDPTSIPERQLILSEAEGLVARFSSLYTRLEDQQTLINQEMSANISEINSLAAGISQLNRAITVALGSGQDKFPNDLLDQRDEKLRELAEFTHVTVIERSNSQEVDVLIGNGQPLVIGDVYNSLQQVQSVKDPLQSDIAFIDDDSIQVISSEITGGKIGALLDFRDNMLSQAFNGIGLIAVGLADTMNHQHEVGMNLEDRLGGLFFTDVNDREVAEARVYGDPNNADPDDRVLFVEIEDASQLTTDDYTLEFNGPTNNSYTLIRNSDESVVQSGRLPAVMPSTISAEGFEITLESGSFQVGDSFLIRPTHTGARDFGMVVDRVEELAFASAIRTDADLGNTGSGVISQGQMLDVNSPLTNQPLSTFSVPNELSPPMMVRFINESYYEVLDATDPANPVPLNPPMNNRLYVPGVSNEVFSNDPGQTATSSLGGDIANIGVAAAPTVNGYSAQTLTVTNRDPDTGLVNTSTVNIAANDSAKVIADQLSQVEGVSATAYSVVEISNFVGAGMGLSINGQAITVTAPDPYDPDHVADAINSNPNLAGQNLLAVSDGNTITLRSMTGDDITVEVTGAGSVDLDTPDPAGAGAVTVNAGNGATIGGFVDVEMAHGVSFVGSNSNIFQANPTVQPTYKGFMVQISGEPEANDFFMIEYNNGGISDNRNALAMVQLENSGTLDGGVNTYNEEYAQLVETIGTVTNQKKIDTDSSEVLLRQSEDAWSEVSGVNLDEEAGRLIQYQAAYNASAQVVSVAQELFDTLLNAVR
ncbi:MAG: flagellar hook-associated protein FlgK [Pseudomonadales bacterium]|nr:flagellar hook-associated protein FlgK [Pseudomonadales bacterium]